MSDQPSVEEATALALLCEDWTGPVGPLEVVSEAFRAATEEWGDGASVVLQADAYLVLAKSQDQEPPSLEAFLFGLADGTEADPEDMATAEAYYADVIGSAVRAMRGGYGWSQAELAALIGVDQTTISAIERGHPTLRMSVLVALAMTFGMSPGDLFEYGERFQR